MSESQRVATMLAALRRRYAEENRRDGQASVQTTFDYACCLLDSGNKQNVRLALNQFEGLIQREGEERDYLYFTAQCHYKLGNFTTAKRYCELVLSREPGNRQVLALLKDIEDGVTRDGAIGLALVGGAAAAVGILAMAILKR